VAPAEPEDAKAPAVERPELETGAEGEGDEAGADDEQPEKPEDVLQVAPQLATPANFGAKFPPAVLDRARNPRSPSPPPTPICRGSGMAVPSPICRGSGVHPRRHPRFAGDRGSSPSPVPIGGSVPWKLLDVKACSKSPPAKATRVRSPGDTPDRDKVLGQNAADRMAGVEDDAAKWAVTVVVAVPEEVRGPSVAEESEQEEAARLVRRGPSLKTRTLHYEHLAFTQRVCPY
jgi:hypothetical protein